MMPDMNGFDVSRKLKEAPIFFGIYTAFIVLGAAVILLPIKSLVQAMLVSQTLNGLLLPVILIAMLSLINDHRLMGRFTNKSGLNLLAWITAVILIILGLVLVVATFFPTWIVLS